MSKCPIPVALLGAFFSVQCAYYQPGYIGSAPRVGVGPPAAHRVRLTEGQVVRIATARTARIVATLREVNENSLFVFDLDKDAATAIPLESVQRLEVRQGTKSNFVKGAGIGFVGVFAPAMLLGLSDCGGGGGNCDWALVVSAFFGGVGALSGGVVGAFMRTDRWVPAEIPLSRAEPGVMPLGGNRLTIGLTLRPGRD